MEQDHDYVAIYEETPEENTEMPNNFYYSDKYNDMDYEYRHVVLPKDMSQRIPKARLMSEAEWRGLGIQQSLGWEHYMIHKPEPHIILFRRPLTDEVKKQVRAEMARKKAEAEDLSGKDIMLGGRRVGMAHESEAA